jgi:hypothetical protein
VVWVSVIDCGLLPSEMWGITWPPTNHRYKYNLPRSCCSVFIALAHIV